MAFLGQNPIETKTIINNKCLEEVSNFNYLDCDGSYESKKMSILINSVISGIMSIKIK